MSKFQSPMLNNGVCIATTDKQTHKHTNKHTYRVKTEEMFFYLQLFKICYFCLKRRFPISMKSYKENGGLYNLENIQL